MFDGQPWFDGFRDLATNGVAKAVLNAFRMLGKLDGDWIETDSAGRLPLEQILDKGVRRAPDVNCTATRDDTGVSILVWNYHDDNIVREADSAEITIEVAGLPAGDMTIREYRMDADHGNAFSAWQAMGSPQVPTPDEIDQLQEAAALPCIDTATRTATTGALSLCSVLPRQAVGLFRIDF